MTLVVNLYGGPGTGKSSIAAGVFSSLKFKGINTELVTEYAKDKVWEEHYAILSHQIYIFGKQHYRISRLLGKVDVIVTDSPLLLSLVYGNEESEEFKGLVVSEYEKLNSFDVFLLRVKPFNPAGRVQSEQASRIIDGQVKLILDKYSPNYYTMTAIPEAIEEIARLTKERIS